MAGELDQDSEHWPGLVVVPARGSSTSVGRQSVTAAEDGRLLVHDGLDEVGPRDQVGVGEQRLDGASEAQSGVRSE